MKEEESASVLGTVQEILNYSVIINICDIILRYIDIGVLWITVHNDTAVPYDV